MAKKRNKKYRAKPCHVLDRLYDYAPEITDSEFAVLDDVIQTSLNLIRLGTWNRECYMNAHSAIRYYWTAAGLFQESEDHRLLALLAAAAIAVLDAQSQDLQAGVVEESDETKAIMAACMRIIEAGIEEYRGMIRMMKRSELVAMERRSQGFSLLKAIKKVALGGAFVIQPGGDNESPKALGRFGITFINGKPRTGFLRRDEDNRPVWVMPKEDMFAVVREPTLICLMDKERKYA